MTKEEIFTQQFLITLEGLVRAHHSIYDEVPPQGIYFEHLVEKAFRLNRIPFTWIQPTTRNVPRHDLEVGDKRFSLKTETGENTNPNFITITKLLTTETGPWEPQALIRHAMLHLARYDYILMLRAIWERPVIHYQVVDIPIALLRLIEGAELEIVGRRDGRRSFGADIYQEGRKIFRVMFDGADGKCSIRRLPVSECQLLRTWDLQISG